MPFSFNQNGVNITSPAQGNTFTNNIIALNSAANIVGNLPQTRSNERGGLTATLKFKPLPNCFGRGFRVLGWSWRFGGSGLSNDRTAGDLWRGYPRSLSRRQMRRAKGTFEAADSRNPGPVIGLAAITARLAVCNFTSPGSSYDRPVHLSLASSAPSTETADKLSQSHPAPTRRRPALPQAPACHSRDSCSRDREWNTGLKVLREQRQVALDARIPVIAIDKHHGRRDRDLLAEWPRPPRKNAP